jgi:iron complex outermembrane receptor protein
MKKNLITASAISLAILGSSFTHTALAQEEEGKLIFEEITVTAKKREQSIYEAPVAISAFTGPTIEKKGILDLVDIGKFVPNLNVTTFSAGHTSSANPFIRGIGLQDHLITTDPGVGVYVDGVYLGRQVGQNWSLSNIERLEVLRGPQGTLYGRNSIGGAINIITKLPGSTEGGRVGMTIGSEGRVNGDFYGDTRMTDTFAVSINGAFKRRGGSGKFLNIENADKDVGETRDISARVAALWTPTEDFSILIAADGNEGENGMNPYTTLIDEIGADCRATAADPSTCANGALYDAGFRNTDVASNPYDNNTGQERQVNVLNRAYGISLTADYALTDELNLKFIASDRHSDYESGLDDDSLFEDFLSFPEVGKADQTSYELQLSGQYDRLDFVTGIYFFEEDGLNDQDPTVFNGGLGDFTLSQEMESTAIYANLGFQVSDALHLSGGVRFTDDEKDAAIIINTGLISTSASRDWSETSWEIAATYELNDSLNIYGTVQNGYQSGQFPPRPFCLFGSLDFTQPGNVSQPNCFVANDNVTAINYETGIKGTPLANLQMSVAVFYTDYSDLPYQVSTTTGGGFDTRSIIVDQTSFGLEWESMWAITDEFMLQTTLGYIDADVDDPDAVAPLTPEITASISPEYTMPLANGADVVLRADWSYRDEMFGEPTSDSGRQTQIDSRSLVNVNFAYHAPNRDWSVALYGRNITNEKYENARLNTGDYILVILNNDIREWGLRLTREF